MKCDKKYYVIEIRSFVLGETDEGEPIMEAQEELIGIQCMESGEWCDESACKIK